MVVGEASIHNIMGGMESTGGVRLHNHKRKLKQRFDIIKKLGQGTYGKVQLGINKETGQEVAIKTIKKCKIETEADLIRIRREIQIMSSVQHPNIIHIYEVFENREKMVLVMEYAAGGELYDYLSERKVLTEHEARRIFRQITTAVFYCHKHKICHRDLKLENILLDQIGNAKIADFGLSNVFDEQRLLSTFCGSPLYASPEIVKGTPYHGPEVDCWSLGVLLYTLVYGAMPFDGSNFKRLVKQISQSDYFEPKKPSPASPLIKEMLTVCPTRRADIEKICTHWWVNEGYEQNCLDIAEELAAQTPVRLDLLLSLVPQSASAEKLVVGDQQAGGDVANSMSSETLVPTRCHSVGSLMELDQNNSDRRIRELVEEEPRATAAGDAKRKLETTPSMDETVAAGVKRKERSRRKDRIDDREPRPYRSTSRHHSAPIPSSIMEEAMEVDPTVVISVPTSKTADLNKIEAAAACLELIKETKEKSPSKERSKTPVAIEGQDKDALSGEIVTENVEHGVSDAKQKGDKVAVSESRERFPKSPSKEASERTQRSPERKKVVKKKIAEASPKEVKNDTCKLDVSNKDEKLASDAGNEVPVTKDTDKADVIVKDEKKNIKKLKEKAMSLDSELLNESAEMLAKPVERRRSKIFETAEKFNQMASNVDNEKPKKIFIPGVNVGGAKRAFERKASLSSTAMPQTVKTCTSKVIIDVPADKKDEKIEEKLNEPAISQGNNKDEKSSKRDEEKKRAIDIITGAIGKPPVQKKSNGSPPISPQNHDVSKLGLKVQVGPNDVRTATVSISTPVETKFPFEPKSALHAEAVLDTPESGNVDNSFSEEPKKSSKMEITLKSATLPRPRKTSKAEITLAGIKSPDNAAFKSEVEAKIDAFHPQKLRTQRSEVAFPVAAAVPQVNRSSSLEPEGRPRIVPKERIIPIQVESEHRQTQHSSTPPPKPPMPQRSMSQRSGSLSRQSTADSDTDSALGSTAGPEPIRKSPREYIIPIAVEGGGYVTPRSGSVEPESKTSTPTSTSAPRSRFGRPRRMSSLLSDASEDESPFSTLHSRDSDDLLQRHMHRLRSSRPTRQPLEHADSLSSGEDDDDDGFELLTAENLFSTLLSRVRSLTQRLNVDDNRSTGFPNSRLLGRLGSNSPQGFWGLHEPLSRRLSESQFRRSLSRDTDRFGRKDSTGPASPGISNSPGTRSTPSRESIFEMGSNTLPRDKVQHEDTEAESTQIRRQAQESLEQNFTPSLARRLSRQFIEQTRQSLPRSPSVPREKNYQSASNLMESDKIEDQYPNTSTSNEIEFRERSAERNIGRSNSLLESGDRIDKFDRRSPRRSISLFDDEDKLLPPLPRQIMTLGRKYRDVGKSSTSGIRRDNFYNYRPDKIQEESQDDVLPKVKVKNVDSSYENGSISECNSESTCNSNTNLIDTASSVSAKSSETSPTESTSNILDYNLSHKSDISRDFENRLLAAENLIKESKLKNLGPSRFNVNLSSSYKDTNKCDKESLGSISDTTGIGKRRSYIPSLRLRSGSLTRESTMDNDRRRSFTGSQDVLGVRAPTPERSILSKFFKPSGSKEGDTKEKSQKSSGQRRISRFLRPDFFDTPREESQYVKEKEAQKAAENERRKSRFIKKRNENKEVSVEEKQVKELKNEANSIAKEKSEISSKDKFDKDVSSISDDTKPKFERQTSKNSFLHSLEKKLEKFRSGDDSSKSAANGGILIERRIRSLRENSVPPTECPLTESNLIKRAVSVEDLTFHSAPLNSPKGKVSSVLGLFKNIDTKSATNGTRPQSTILSKLKKNSYKVSRSDTVLEGDVPSTSKIPTKFTKTDSKSTKKIVENKRSPEKVVTESKRSPPKDKVKENEKNTLERMGVNVKKLSPEGVSNVYKKSSPENLLEKTMDTFNETTDAQEMGTENNIGLTEKRNSLPDKVVPSNEASFERMTDNKEIENRSNESENKQTEKIKKSMNSLTSLAKNGLTPKAEKSENAEKKVKKVSKPKETIEKEAENGTKKKKIIRVVKKVVKKSSDNSDSKSDGKEKSSKTSIKKISSSTKEKSPVEQPVVNKDKEISPIAQDSNKIKELGPKCNMVVDTKPERSVNGKILMIADEKLKDSTSETTVKKESVSRERTNVNPPDLRFSRAPKVNSEKVAENNANSLNFNVTQSKSSESRANRNSLKLDLSKIPQHTFRNTQPSKKELPKSEASKVESPVDADSPKSSQKDAFKPENDTEKLIESLSKITHRANITGNKIIIDKPLCAKDVADLREEANVSCNTDDSNVNPPRLHDQKSSSPQKIVDLTENRLHENKPNRTLNASMDHSESENTPNDKTAASRTNLHVNNEREENYSASQELKSTCNYPHDSLDNQKSTPNECLLDASSSRKNRDLSLPAFSSKRIPPSKGSSNDYTDDMFSPMDDTESFDSWSICSADMNHTRSELHSPTSPMYSPSIRGDQPESIIDRIRRKSFYSRFNDRRRKTSLTAPPPGVSLPVSATLPRRFSFNRPKDVDRNKLSSYSSLGRIHPERSYSSYNEDTPSYGRSSVDRDRYSDTRSTSSYSSDLKSPVEQYGSLTSSYDPLRTYVKSPTLDSINHRRKYHSTDFGIDELGLYRGPLSSSLLNDGPMESYSSRSIDMLPKKYGSAVTNLKPKTAEYYEELLAPSKIDYFSSRKSPMPGEYLNRYENGYHSENLNLPQFKVDKWKTYSDNVAGVDFTEAKDERDGDQVRDRSQTVSESKDLPLKCSEPQPSTSTAD